MTDAYSFEDVDDERRQLLVEPDQRPERVAFLTSRVESAGDLIALEWTHLCREQVAALADVLVDWLDDE